MRPRGLRSRWPTLPPPPLRATGKLLVASEKISRGQTAGPKNDAVKKSARPRSAPVNYLVTQLDEIPAVPCPCGMSRRGFATPDNAVATIHLVDISIDARIHYHQRMTEIYLVLEGEGFIELDGERIPARPMMSVLIRPGCRHRLVGRFRIVNVAIPAFDPADEWFD